MKKILYLVAIWSICISCKDEYIEKPEIRIDVSSIKNVYLEEITSDIKIFPLKLNGFLTDQCYIKSYADYYFIFDTQQEKIFVITSDGKHISTLDKKGRGAGEYLDLSCFAYNQEKQYLTIFNRSHQRFMNYSVPELNYIGGSKYHNYIMSMEYIDNNKLFVTKESELDASGALELLEIKKDSFYVNYSQKSNYVSIELSPDATITRNKKNEVLYTESGYCNIVYKIDSNGFTPIKKFDFGINNIAKKIWESDIDQEMNLMIEMQGKTFATLPQYVINNSAQQFCCWFLLKDKDNSDFPEKVVYIQNSKDEPKVIKDIKLKDIDNISLQAIGVINDYYVSIIEPELVDSTTLTDSQLSKDIVSMAKNKKELIVILYKL